MLVISGASGHLGRAVATTVAQRLADPRDLILTTRRPEALGDFSARGVVVRRADFSDPETLVAAFAGGTRLLLISTDTLAGRAEQHRTALLAAAAAGVRHVVYTSVVSAPANLSVIAESHYATELALQSSGLAWTLLRFSLYAEFQGVEAAQALRTGTLLHNRGGGRCAYVSRKDCSRAAAAVLTSEGHEGAIYDITGPRSFDATELAALYSDVGGRLVRPIALDDDDLIATLVGDDAGGHLRYGAELVASFGRAIRAGGFANYTTCVADLTGEPARPLRAVLAADRKLGGW